MSSLYQRRYVQCPVNQAVMHLDAFVEGLDRDPTGAAKMALRAPVVLAELNTEIVLQHDVIVSVRPEPGHHGTYDVTWAPDGGGLFPTFAGKLSVESAEDYDGFMLLLAGTYDPPLGVAGKAFDAAIGHRIAVTSARDLLGRISTSVERSFADLEQAKTVHREAHLLEAEQGKMPSA